MVFLRGRFYSPSIVAFPYLWFQTTPENVLRPKIFLHVHKQNINTNKNPEAQKSQKIRVEFPLEKSRILNSFKKKKKKKNLEPKI